VSGPLSGLRVLDFAWIGAGALVTKALAELGAEVIRIESRARPDNLRQSPPFKPGTSGLDASGYFASRNPRIVYLTMPMQGRDGPHRNFVGFGSTIAALAGLAHTTAVPGRAPIGTGTHYPDHVPNPGHALVALLAAVFHQQRTGEGQYVELSQLESTVNVVGQGILYSSVGAEVEPAGNHQPGCAPRGTYRCAEGEWVALSCQTEEQWDTLAKVLDRTEWLSDSKFGSMLDRLHHADELDDLLRTELSSRIRATVVAELTAAGVPAGPVNSSKDMLTDPHLSAREFWQPVQHAVIGEIPMFHLPFRLDDSQRPTMTPPPLLGEHTREVATTLLELSDDDYEKLVEEGLFQ
jgi:benzylsuccinate CoA-transferase BbsF subunit